LLHTNMLTVNRVKMSKSLGNSFNPVELFTGMALDAETVSATPSEAKLGGKHPLLDKGYSPMSVRFFMLQTHYSSTLDFSNEALTAAEKGFKRLMEAIRTLEKLTPSADSTVDVADLRKRCLAAMNDDFNTPILMAELFDGVRITNSVKDGKERLDAASLDELRKLMHGFVFDVLGLKDDLSNDAGDLAGNLMQLIIQLRAQARKDKNFGVADQIRDGLGAAKVKLKDTPDGTDWYVEE
jgi:cysteinyl-tRNA synthetase